MEKQDILMEYLHMLDTMNQATGLALETIHENAAMTRTVINKILFSTEETKKPTLRKGMDTEYGIEKAVNDITNSIRSHQVGDKKFHSIDISHLDPNVNMDEVMKLVDQKLKDNLNLKEDNVKEDPIDDDLDFTSEIK